MVGEIIGTDWLTRRRSKDQVTGLWIQILRTLFSLQITEKGNNPALQLDWTAASRMPGIREAPFHIQPPDATEDAKDNGSPTIGKSRNVSYNPISGETTGLPTMHSEFSELPDAVSPFS